MAKTVVSERFRSVFVASIAAMAMFYVILLIDNVVAGQFVGEEAVAAMTLVDPIMTFIFFLSYMISDGLAMMFSYALGHNDQLKANQLFSMGTICSLVLGIFMTIMLVGFHSDILSFWKISPELMTYADDYFRGLMLMILPCLLNTFFYTIYIAEGEEKVCLRASAAMFVVNIVLDIILGYYIGVFGIGLATAISTTVSLIFHIPYLFSKNCPLKFVKYFNWNELWQGIFYSWYHSMDTLYLAILPVIFSTFILTSFGESSLIIVTVVVNMITLLMMIYTGIVDCIQPMVCQYHAENALHSVRKTMILCFKYTIAMTLVTILFNFVFAEFLPILFGVDETEPVYDQAVFALRIFMPFTLFLGVVLMLSNYYIYIERLNLGALIKTLLLLILPSIGMFAGLIDLWLMWIGVGTSFILALVINYFIVHKKFLLIDSRQYSNQFSFDLTVKSDEYSLVEDSLQNFFNKNFFDELRKHFIANCIEKIFLIYCARKEIFQLEISILPEKNFTTIIFRDNGTPNDPLNEIEKLFDDIIEKNYMISGDENKLVVTL